MVKKLFIAIFFIFSALTTIAQLPEVPRGYGNVIAVDTNGKFVKRLELPHDTLPTASVGSLASIGAVVYVKNISFWQILTSLSSENFIPDWAVDTLSHSPVITTDGYKYLVLPTGTGAFSGHNNEIAEYSSGTPSFSTPTEGDFLQNADDGSVYKYVSGTWIFFAPGVIYAGGNDFNANFLKIGNKHANKGVSILANNQPAININGARSVAFPAYNGIGDAPAVFSSTGLFKRVTWSSFLDSLPTPTLHQVTTAGNRTTNNFYVIDESNVELVSNINASGEGEVNINNNTDASSTSLRPGYIRFTGTDDARLEFAGSSYTTYLGFIPGTHVNLLNLPDKSGTLATTDDLGSASNFANTDLTFTGNRFHDAAGYNLSVENFHQWYLNTGTFSTTKGQFLIDTGDVSMTATDGTTNFAVLRAGNAGQLATISSQNTLSGTSSFITAAKHGEIGLNALGANTGPTNITADAIDLVTGQEGSLRLDAINNYSALYHTGTVILSSDISSYKLGPIPPLGATNYSTLVIDSTDGSIKRENITISSGTVTSVSGTTNRVTSTGGATPVIDISSTFEGLLLKKADNLSGLGSTSTSRTNLGVAIGSDVQAFNSNLATIAGLTATTDNFIVSVGSAWASRTPAQVKTTLGATTAGNNFFTLTNPSAITFPRINADNTVDALSASSFRTAIGAGTGDGSVASVSGTANQIASTGGTTPVLSLVSSAILPGSPTIASPGNSTQNIVTTDATQTLSNKTFTAPILGTPASGTVTNLTGTASININGTVGATTPAAGTFTTGTVNTSLTMADAANVILNTTTGTKFGTGTTQKLAFYNSTPIVQPTGSIKTALGNLGLVASASIAESEITFTNITTGNASSSAHGYLPILPNTSTTLLDGTGAFVDKRSPSGSVSGSDVTTTSGTAVDVTGMTAAVGANKRYAITATLWIGCNNTGGLKLGINGPSGSALLSGVWDGSSTSSTSGQKIRVAAIGSLNAGVAFNRVNANTGMVVLNAEITTSSTPGNITIQFASGNSGETSTVLIGSTVYAIEMQ